MKPVLNHGINSSSPAGCRAAPGSISWGDQGLSGPADEPLRPQDPRFQRTHPRVIAQCTRGTLGTDSTLGPWENLPLRPFHYPPHQDPPLSQVPCRMFSAVLPKGGSAELLRATFHPEHSERCPCSVDPRPGVYDVCCDHLMNQMAFNLI